MLHSKDSSSSGLTQPQRGPLTVLVVTGRTHRSEASLLLALRRAGVHLKILGRADSAHTSRLEHAGVPFVPLLLLGPRDRSGREAIRWHLDDTRPEIVHLMGREAIANGLAAAKGREVRTVLYRRIVGDAGVVSPLDWAAYMSPRVDRIVCPAEAVRRSMLARGCGPFRVPAEKLVTIYMGYDLDWYRAEPLDLAIVGVPSDAFVVTCTADAAPEECVSWVVRASERLPSGLPIHFVLTGRVMSKPATTKLVRRSPYRDRFHVLGFREDEARILAASDASVRLGSPREGLPRGVVESMVYRTVPIVGDGGAAAELIEHERSGLLVPAADEAALAAAILRLYRDPILCRELGRNAYRRIATVFTVEKAAAQTLRMYRQLVTWNDPSGA